MSSSVRLAIKEKHGRRRSGSLSGQMVERLQKLEIVPLTTAFLTSSLESLMRRGPRPVFSKR